jgi:hypothetical protein
MGRGNLGARLKMENGFSLADEPVSRREVISERQQQDEEIVTAPDEEIVWKHTGERFPGKGLAG